jgi:hypothetical protein
MPTRVMGTPLITFFFIVGGYIAAVKYFNSKQNPNFMITDLQNLLSNERTGTTGKFNQFNFTIYS